MTIGCTPAGKRIVRRGNGKTKTEDREKLREVVWDYEDGLAIASAGYSLADGVSDWLQYSLGSHSDATRAKNASLSALLQSWFGGQSGKTEDTKHVSRDGPSRCRSDALIMLRKPHRTFGASS